MRDATKELIVDGLWHRNPAMVQLLGLCPLLAVSSTAIDALALGLATLLTLLVSNVAVSLLRDLIAPAVRLPMQIAVIAGTVTVIELLMAAWLPALHSSLGIFLPLIVTNCLILARSEAFARHRTPGPAAIDGLATGSGFALALLALGMLREAIGQGSLFSGAERLIGGDTVVTGLLLFPAQHGLILAVLPPGAFILLGLLLALCKPERRHERVDHKTDASPGTTPDTTPIKAPEPQVPTS